jgi:hypothetical protein
MAVAAELEVGKEGLLGEVRDEDGPADLEGPARDGLVGPREDPRPARAAVDAPRGLKARSPSRTRNRARSAATSSKTISAMRASRRCVMVFVGSTILASS